MNYKIKKIIKHKEVINNLLEGISELVQYSAKADFNTYAKLIEDELDEMEKFFKEEN